MAIREIRKYDDPVLYKVCRPVEKFDERLWELLDDMAETMYEANGVGLAAPQVGILRRVVVIDVGDGIIELVNPRILRTAGKETTRAAFPSRANTAWWSAPPRWRSRPRTDTASPSG